MTQVQYRFSSHIGSIYITANENGLQSLYWKKQNAPLTENLNPQNPAENHLILAVSELEKYFSGHLEKFTVPLNLNGTPFQIRVWNELLKIPFGKTISYSELAERVKNPKAFRAVGTANGRNPISLIVPCHRVIAADGTLGGYSGGLKIKQQLLDFEQKTVYAVKSVQ